MLMGSKASASAGLAVVHYKEDLRAALQAARDAEQLAKQSGKDALALSVWRRSGEHALAVMEWEFTEDVQRWTDRFVNGASDRWTYKLRQELPVLVGLEMGAFKAEIRRLVKRARDGKEKAFREEDLIGALDRYHDGMLHRPSKDAWSDDESSQLRELKIRTDFVTLLQAASFLARGRDD
jgi:CRISPR-associated protein Cmr2